MNLVDNRSPPGTVKFLPYKLNRIYRFLIFLDKFHIIIKYEN